MTDIAVQSGRKQAPGFFELADLPWSELFPPHAFAVDHQPWRGNKISKFEMIYRHGREMAARINGWRNSNPQQHQEAIEKGRQMLVHLTASRNALLQSWAPLGMAN